MGVMALVGCEKPEPMGNTQTTVDSQSDTNFASHNTGVSYSQCKSQGQRDVGEETISTNYENGILRLMVENLCVNCGFDSISAVSVHDAQTISVKFIEICEHQANCICPIDVNCTIDNIKAGTYELIISKDDSVIYQEEIICEQ